MYRLQGCNNVNILGGGFGLPLFCSENIMPVWGNKTEKTLEELESRPVTDREWRQLRKYARENAPRPEPGSQYFRQRVREIVRRGN
jgi:hypothetical protein